MAVSGEMPLRSRTTSLIRGVGTPNALASALTLMLRGARKSSRSTSPGCTGRMPLRNAITHASSVIVSNLNILRSSIGPTKTNAPLVIDANAMLSSAVSFELLQTIARRGAQELKVSLIELDSFVGDLTIDDRFERPFQRVFGSPCNGSS